MCALRPVLLLTRPAEASERFASQLPPDVLARVDLIISPLIRIEPLVQSLDFGPARGLIFTSANGVRVVDGVTEDRLLPSYCVGEKTAATARDAGWNAHALGATADELVAALLRDRPEGPLLHLSGEHTRGDIAARLCAAGLPTAETAVYAQPLQPLDDAAQRALVGKMPVIVPLFSPRTARHFAEQAIGPAPVHAIALSESVAEPLKPKGFSRVDVALRPDAGAMVEAIAACLAGITRVEGARPPQ